MTDSANGPPGQDTAKLVRDWLTIWQSELNASADDRERSQACAWLHAQWATDAQAGLAPSGFARPARPAAPQPPAGAAPVAAAPDARDAAIRQLAERVEDLERRLAGLDPTTRP